MAASEAKGKRIDSCDMLDVISGEEEEGEKKPTIYALDLWARALSRTKSSVLYSQVSVSPQLGPAAWDGGHVTGEAASDVGDRCKINFRCKLRGFYFSQSCFVHSTHLNSLKGLRGRKSKASTE